jgi:predicted small lipoprotein YifL
MQKTVVAAAALLTMTGCGAPSTPLGPADGSAKEETAQLSSEQDARVAGTAFNAVAEIQCSGLNGAGQTVCRAGVVRRVDGSADVTISGGDNQRTLKFDAAGRATSSDASPTPPSSRMDQNGWITVNNGAERYSFPIEFLNGD